MSTKSKRSEKKTKLFAQPGEMHFKFKSKSHVLRYLSNFHPATIEYDGRTFPSIEHAYQGEKIKYAHVVASKKGGKYKPMTIDDFTVDGEFGDQPANKAKSAGGKTVMKKHHMTLDMAAFNKHRLPLMKALVKARFETDALYRKIIRKAVSEGIQLIHFEKTRGSAKTRAIPFWGAFRPKGSKDLLGENHLGKIMMELGKGKGKTSRKKKSVTNVEF